MFDKDMRKQYLFLNYLLNLLPVDQEEPVDLEGKLKLEYYKLQKTFEGEVELKHANGVWEPPSQKSAQGKQEKSTLDEIIEKVNEKFKGDFTDADKVIWLALHDTLVQDTKLASSARTSDPQIFTESIFPAYFGNAAMENFEKQQDGYQSLFADKHKYNAVMSALAGVIYRELRENNGENLLMVAESEGEYRADRI